MVEGWTEREGGRAGGRRGGRGTTYEFNEATTGMHTRRGGQALDLAASLSKAAKRLGTPRWKWQRCNVGKGEELNRAVMKVTIALGLGPPQHDRARNLSSSNPKVASITLPRSYCIRYWLPTRLASWVHLNISPNCKNGFTVVRASQVRSRYRHGRGYRHSGDG